MTSSVTPDFIINPSFVYTLGSDSQYAKLWRVIDDRRITNGDTKLAKVQEILAQKDFPSLAFEEGTQIKVITVSRYRNQYFTFWGYALRNIGGLRIAEFMLEKYPLLAQDIPSFNIFMDLASRGRITDEKTRDLYGKIFKTFVLSGMRLELYWKWDEELNYTNSRFNCTALYRIASNSDTNSTFLPIIQEYALSFRQISIIRTLPEIASIPVPIHSIIADYLCVRTLEVSLNVDINRYSSGKPDMRNVHTALGVAVERGNIDIIPSLMYLGAEPNLPHNKGEGTTDETILEKASPEVRAAVLGAVLPEDRARILAATSPAVRAAVEAYNALPKEA